MMAAMRSVILLVAGLVLGLGLGVPAGCGAVEAGCAEGSQCVCKGLGSCEYDCPDGNCAMSCEGAGACEFSCESGGCDVVCQG